MMKKLTLLFSAAAFAAAVGIYSPIAMADGAKAFKKNRCKQCHTVTGKHTIGPSLKGIMGRTAGTAEGFKKKRYSKDMIAAGEKGLVWNEKTMDKFLTKPKKFLAEYLGKKKARTKMAFPGIKNEKKRKQVIDYLMTQK